MPRRAKNRTMMDHVTERLQRLRNRAGLSTKDMAKLMGFAGPSSYHRYERQDEVKRLSQDILVRIARVLVGRGHPPIEMHEVMALGEPDNSTKKNLVDRSTEARFDSGRSTATPAAVATFIPEADRIPLRGMDASREHEGYVMIDTPIGEVERPPVLKNKRDAYAMHCVGDSMKPMYRQGQTLFVNPYLPPRTEDGIIIYMAHGETVLVKEFVRQTATELWVKEYEPKKREWPIPMDKIRKIHTVVGTQG